MLRRRMSLSSSRPMARSRNGLVGHYLRALAQAIARAGINGDAKVRCFDDFRRHLTDDNGGVGCGERIGLHNHRRSRLTVVTAF